jgi:glutamyl-tRNA reductase
MHLLLVGLSHAEADVRLRELAAVGTTGTAVALRLLQHQRAVGSAFVLATCNRTELYATSSHLRAGRRALHEVLSALHPSGYPVYRCALYEKSDDAAAEHLFRVAAGVESAVVGESQIVAQLRFALQQARRSLPADALLAGTTERAIAAGRRVRREVPIAQRRLSIGTATVDFIRQALGSVNGRKVVVLGAGQVADLCLRALVRGGAIVTVAARKESRAEALASRFGAEAVGVERLADAIAYADVVVGAASADHPILRRDMFGRRSQLVLDLALPRSAEAALDRVPGIRVADLDDVARAARRSPEAEARLLESAGRVLADELRAWRDWRRSLAAGPGLQVIADYAEQVRQAEVERALRGLAEQERDAAERIDRLSRSLVSKLLLHPIAYLRTHPEDEAAVELVERLFRAGA